MTLHFNLFLVIYACWHSAINLCLLCLQSGHIFSIFNIFVCASFLASQTIIHYPDPFESDNYPSFQCTSLRKMLLGARWFWSHILISENFVLPICRSFSEKSLFLMEVWSGISIISGGEIISMQLGIPC